MPILVYSLFALKKARAVGQNVGNFNLFIKVGITRSDVVSRSTETLAEVATQ